MRYTESQLESFTKPISDSENQWIWQNGTTIYV